ncbi:M48 family metalloprotease [Streptomyces sp. NPDC005574]|uniref:M48 family metallopeptidase n=1 Tax=Streptomyces sp. NPDC005574 TaxID=3156891 RepID=UPI0033BC430F
MGTTPRAFRALPPLAGFLLLGGLPPVLLATGDHLLHRYAPGAVAAALTLVTLLPAVLAVLLVRGLRTPRAERGEATAGLTVTEADQPELWRTVRELADGVGTRVPSRIVLTAEVDASVSEAVRLFGLLPGPLRLHLGVPLVQGLSEAQLRAVLAHELGHRADAGTRFATLALRARTHALRTVTRIGRRADRAAARERIPSAYARLCLRSTLAVARRQEYAADAAAVRVAGRDATASALRELPVLEAAFGFYRVNYAMLGSGAGLLPPRGEVFGGFGRMLSARRLEMAGLRADPSAGPSSPYDSHPPLADRVRRIEELPDDGRTHEARGAALSLLYDPERIMTALEDTCLADDLRHHERTRDWQELLDRTMAASLASSSTPLQRALALYTEDRPTIPALLRVIEDGGLWQLAKRLPVSDHAVDAQCRAFRAFVRPTLHKSLSSMALAELSARSLLRWEFSWERAAVPHLPPAADGTRTDLDAAVVSAVADAPDTAPLRALLTPGA